MADTPQPAPGAADTEQSPPLTALIPPQSAQDILGGVQAGAQAAPQPQPVAPPDATGTIPLQPTTGTVPTNESQSLFHRAMYDMKGVLAKVADILGPSEIAKVTQDPQTGDYMVSKQPATTGEKWGRIAAAALGGLATGLQNAQGPGGFARAAGAGIQTGMQQPQQQQQQAQQEASYQQGLLLAKANRIHLTQTNYLLTQELANAKLEYTAKQAAMLEGIMAEYANNPGAKEMAVIDPSDPDSVVNAANTVPGLMDSFLQKNNKQIMPLPGPDHKIHLFQTDMAWGKQRNNVPRTFYYVGKGEDGEATLLSRNVPVGGDTNENIDNSYLSASNALATLNLNIGKANEAEANAKKQPNITNPTELQLAIQRETDPVKKAQLQASLTASQNDPEAIARRNAQAASARAENARADLTTQQLNILRGGTGAGAAAAQGLHGEQWLQQSGLDPSSFAQIRAAANGDIQLPSASRSPQNQAFRNAVLNYDPTFTDARYQAKQDFKNKKQADSLQSLSTGLEHVENALTNSAILGTSPSLLTGKNLSGAASAYNQDVNLFTEEAGKMVKGGVLGQEEYNALKQGMQSPIQSIRDSAIHETINLLGGRVASAFQRYKTATNQDLPVEQFFDAPTQARLKRYSIPQPAGGPVPTPPTLDQSNPPPLSKLTPGQNTTFANGQTWTVDQGRALRIK